MKMIDDDEEKQEDDDDRGHTCRGDDAKIPLLHLSS